MEATYLSSRGIVQEVLRKHNYKRWKSLMKNYLVGKDLWDIVEGDLISEIEPRTWRKKNAEALHIIQLSCEPKIIDEISGFDTAKEAWDHLGLLYDPELKAEPDIEQGIVLDDDLPERQRELYLDVRKGDWEATRAKINDSVLLHWTWASGSTILHVATMAGHVEIVEGLVRQGRGELALQQDSKGYTALALAADYTGNKDVAERMVNVLKEVESRSVVNESPNENERGNGNESLLTIPNNDGKIPLLLAAAAGHKEMTRYLYEKTPLDVSLRNRILQCCIKAEIFDVALKVVEPPESLSCEDCRALSDLAQMPSAFLSGCQFGWLQKIIYKSEGLLNINICGIGEIYEQKRTHDKVHHILQRFGARVARFTNSQLNEALVYAAMLNAARHGIIEFIDAMRLVNPNLLWVRDSHKRDIFSYAVLHRKENVFQLIYSLKGRKDILKYRKDVFGNNMLHLAGYIGPSSDLSQNPGAALQLQREIQWFKAVEKVVHPRCKEDKNNDGKKPHEVFAESHQKLLEEGEKWAKVTAKSFSLVATLLSSIMFAALFTLPGGNHQNTGVPLLLHDCAFKWFIIADAVSLFTSITSVVIFVEILTSRFSQNDFLKSLPLKLVFGLFFLFLSVVWMVVAFCAALAIVLKKDNEDRIWLLSITIGCIPVTVFVLYQIILMWKILQSTMSNPINGARKSNWSCLKQKKKITRLFRKYLPNY